jgi:4-hydroxy-2-oxovalerate aldolase
MKTTILDVTLRDGSYELDFQVSEQDEILVGAALEKAGIEYIEIGHGQGLNASSPKNGVARCTDLEYLVAAEENFHKAKYGFFCIPGIARLEDLNLLKNHGGSFVRVGANCDLKSQEGTAPFIERAKELGLIVFANYMKTYCASPDVFEKCVRISDKAGADYLTIVDSAGCMFPEDIKMYYDIIKNTATREVGVGFHGHDNLGYAVYNTVYAATIGCEFIDTSLQSLGRGAGNASTEQVIAVLQKKYGVDTYSLPGLMHFSEEYLRPMVKFKGVSGLDTYCGIAGFHSGYMNSIRKVAKEFNVSPYSLIVAYCKHDRIYMNEELLRDVAKEIQHEKS